MSQPDMSSSLTLPPQTPTTPDMVKKPATRKTYGRPRQQVTSGSNDVDVSPAKALLDKFTTHSNDWLNSGFMNGAPDPLLKSLPIPPTSSLLNEPPSSPQSPQHDRSITSSFVDGLVTQLPDKPITSSFVKGLETQPPVLSDDPDSLDQLSSSLHHMETPPKSPTTTRAKLTDYSTNAFDAIGGDATDEEDDEDDEEAVKREMERMKREARGEIIEPLQDRDDNVPPRSPVRSTKLSNELAVPNQALVFGSSSLSAIPTSAPNSGQHLVDAPKSDPPVTSDIDAEETAPVRRLGTASGRRPHVVYSDDDDDDADKTIRPDQVIAGTSSHRGISASEENGSDDDEDDDEDDKMRSATISPSRDRAATASTSSAPPSSPPRPRQEFGAFMLTLQESEDSDGVDETVEPESKTTPKKKAVPSSQSEIREFEDEKDERSSHKKVVPKKIKPLSKTEHNLTLQGIAHANRDQPVKLNKPEQVRLPMSGYMLDAERVVQVIKPALARAPTAEGLEDITTYSSGNRTRGTDPAAKPSTGKLASKIPSSPTPRPAHDASGRNRHPSPPSDDNEDADEDLKTILEEQKKRNKREALNKWKGDVARRQTQSSKTHLEDDDFEIIPDTSKKNGQPQFSSANSTEGRSRSGPDARRVLSKGSPQRSSSRQTQLRLAGRREKPSESTTDPHFPAAGKANFGALPPGAKRSRIRPPSQAELYEQLKEKHRSQEKKVREAKEAQSGYVAFKIPEKQAPDLEAHTIAAVHDQAETTVDDDDDPEDGDYNGDDDTDDELVEDRLGLGSEVEDEPDAHDPEVNDDQEVGSPIEQLNEIVSPTNTGIDEEDDDGPVRFQRKSRSSGRPMVLQDDEESQLRPPVSRIPLPSLTARTQQVDHGGFDLGGFGDVSGSPGFSQLFDPTQMDGTGAFDGFGGLRADGPGDLLRVNALLPGVDLSETQAARDNALIAGEIEMAMEERVPTPMPKKKYLNDRGYLTQTKPATYVPSQLERFSSDLLSSPKLQSSTQKNTPSPSFTERDETIPLEQGPRSPTPILTRLKRRNSDEDEEMPMPNSEEEDGDEDKDGESIRAGGQTPNANDVLMKTAQPRKDKTRRPKTSAFVDGQAEESGDEGGWKVPGAETDDEDGSEKDEGYLSDVVDDQIVDEDQQREQDERAKAKLRQDEEQDEQRRLAEAQNVVNGGKRLSRKGQDFISGDEAENEENQRNRRANKKRKGGKRDLGGKKDGLDELDGDAPFLRVYQQGLAGDDSAGSADETETSEKRQRTTTTQRDGNDGPGLTASQQRERIRQLGEENRTGGADESIELDFGLQGSGFTARAGMGRGEDDGDPIDVDPPTEEESQSYSISNRLSRSASLAKATESQAAGPKKPSEETTARYDEYIRGSHSKGEGNSTGKTGNRSVYHPKSATANSGVTATRINTSTGRTMPLRRSTGSSLLGNKSARFEP